MSADPKDAAQQAASTIVCGLDIRYEPGYATRADVIAAVTKLIEGRCFDQAHDEMRLLRVKLVTAETQRDSAKTDAYAALERAKAAEQKISDWAQAKAMTELLGGSSYADLERQANELALRAEAAEQRAEEESEYAALVAAGIKHWQGCPNNAATGGTELSPCLRCQVETLARERDEATAKLEKAQRAIWHMRYRNHKFSIGCAGCMDAETTLAALDSQPK